VWKLLDAISAPNGVLGAGLRLKCQLDIHPRDGGRNDEENAIKSAGLRGLVGICQCGCLGAGE
jgi:hypothetical protein